MENRSGMHRVAQSFVDAERKLGIDSVLANPTDETKWVYDADINVSHTHLPDKVQTKVPFPFFEPKKKEKPMVWISHGTPDHVFQSSVEQAHGYGHHDGWMLVQNWLRTAHACVTFWPRHQRIWQSMCQRGRKVHLVPLGVDKEFWRPGESRGKFAGTPSVLNCENQHYIKWSWDLLVIWPWILEHLESAKLHQLYLPNDCHRWFFPLVNSNGASYGAYISSSVFDHEDLRNAYRSCDFYCGLVRYGDFNRVSLEANASGTKTISYRGNPYSDYWITEGDQRDMARELLAILKGEVEPRQKEQPPDISETAKAMIEIYNTI